uniref:Uncharacterized protein n=1 Tax=Vespula pensylvanica TaxID=30213 RepID=A0A834JYW6_VESPE|nr:hypothetical protein H0235_016518 [Vespula pensylvanica]
MPANSAITKGLIKKRHYQWFHNIEGQNKHLIKRPIDIEIMHFTAIIIGNNDDSDNDDYDYDNDNDNDDDDNDNEDDDHNDEIN